MLYQTGEFYPEKDSHEMKDRPQTESPLQLYCCYRIVTALYLNDRVFFLKKTKNKNYFKDVFFGSLT